MLGSIYLKKNGIPSFLFIYLIGRQNSFPKDTVVLLGEFFFLAYNLYNIYYQ